MIIIKTMVDFLKPPSIRQVWAVCAVRALTLVGALFIAGYYGLLNSEVAFICLGWLLLSLLTSLAMVNGWHAEIHFRLSGLADLALGITLIAQSGWFQSPLWWALIIGPLGYAVVDGIVFAPLCTFAALASVYLLPTIVPGLEPYPFQTLLPYALILLPASALLAWLGIKLIDGMRLSTEEARPLAERVRRKERSRANELVRMAVDVAD